MSEMRIKKRERQASPSPERLPERKKPKAKVNDKIRIPINTNTTNVKSALRIKDLADRWIKQMGSIGRVIDGDYSALAPSWKEEIMYDFLLPLLHTILKYIPHKSHFFEAMEECAYWRAFESSGWRWVRNHGFENSFQMKPDVLLHAITLEY